MKNNINFVIVIFLVPLLLGCTAKRGMLSDSIYYSSDNPNLQIEVKSAFQYKKGEKGKLDHQFFFPNGGQWLYIHRYTFESANMTQVDYYDHPSHWIYYGIPTDTILTKGETEILGKTWYFANNLNYNDIGCYVIKNLRRFTSDNNVFSIRYIHRYYTCDKLESPLVLDSGTEKLLKEFEKSFRKAVTITSYSSSEQKIRKDNKISVEDFRLAAEQGFADAQYNYGLIHEKGEGVPQNDNKAAEWYRKSAEQGYIPAQKKLKIICRKPLDACE